MTIRKRARAGLSSRNRPDRSPGGFRLKERLIYRYWNGKRFVDADPLELQFALMGERLEDEAKIMAMDIEKVPIDPRSNVFDQALQGQLEAYKRVLNAIASIFAVDRFDGKHGLTDIELFALLGHFTTFMSQLKKKANVLPTSARPTESATSASPTSSMSASASIKPESPISAPTPSPGESPSSSELPRTQPG
jgi:hypothetical protein